VDLRKTLFVLPNLVTLASVFCGVAAILLVAGPRTSNERFIEPARCSCSRRSLISSTVAWPE